MIVRALGVLLAGVLAVASDDCDESSGGHKTDSGDGAAAAPSTSVAIPQPDGAVLWQCVPPPEPCRDEIVYEAKDSKSTRCTSPQAHGREVMYGDKDSQKVALLCSCHNDPLPQPPPASSTKPDAGK